MFQAEAILKKCLLTEMSTNIAAIKKRLKGTRTKNTMGGLLFLLSWPGWCKWPSPPQQVLLTQKNIPNGSIVIVTHWPLLRWDLHSLPEDQEKHLCVLGNCSRLRNFDHWWARVTLVKAHNQKWNKKTYQAMAIDLTLLPRTCTLNLISWSLSYQLNFVLCTLNILCVIS